MGHPRSKPDAFHPFAIESDDAFDLFALVPAKQAPLLFRASPPRTAAAATAVVFVIAVIV